MGVVGQMTPSEGAGATASTTEIGGQSTLWKEHAPDHGHPALAEIPDEETAGSPQFKRARLAESFEDEQEKAGENETEQIGPENILKTKS